MTGRDGPSSSKRYADEGYLVEGAGKRVFRSYGLLALYTS